MSLDALEEGVNEISDRDRNWWPFLWLRPARDKELTLARLVVIALLYGVPTGALATLLLALAVPEARESAAAVVGASVVAFLLFATAVVGPMWNRRAQRLRARAPFGAR
jgi:hypothetical protein